MAIPDCTCTHDVRTLARLGAEGRLPHCPIHNDHPAPAPSASAPALALNDDDGLAAALERAMNVKLTKTTNYL